MFAPVQTPPVSIRKPYARKSLLSGIRYGEIILLQGTPWMGIFIGARHPGMDMSASLSVFGVAGLLLVGHIWMLNDWADAPLDAKDAHRADRVPDRSLPQLFLSLALLACGLGLFCQLPPPALSLASAVAVLGYVYSCMGGKRTPVVSSVVHFVGGCLHFLLGYCVVSPIDRAALLWAPFFGLVFAAGHAIQEIRDAEADGRSGIATNAVVFGKRPVFIAALIGFMAAYGFLDFLAVAGAAPRFFAFLAPLLAVVHLFFSLKTLNEGLGYRQIKSLRANYRTNFLLIGACLFAGFLMRAISVSHADADTLVADPVVSVEEGV